MGAYINNQFIRPPPRKQQISLIRISVVYFIDYTDILTAVISAHPEAIRKYQSCFSHLICLISMGILSCLNQRPAHVSVLTCVSLQVGSLSPSSIKKGCPAIVAVFHARSHAAAPSPTVRSLFNVISLLSWPTRVYLKRQSLTSS